MESDEHNQESYLKRLWSLLRGEKTEIDTEKEIEKLLDEVEERGFIDEEQGDMIHNIVVLKDTLAREIMVPKVDMVAAEVSSSIDDLVELITKEGCSRIPIYEESLDNIIGVVYAKDILKFWKCQDSACDIRSLMQPPYFVPEGKKLIDLLKEFRTNRPKIAIVIDEYGTVDGLLTIGDIVEEIVGDMVEEGDQTDEEEIVQKAAGIYVVDPKLSVDEFAEEFETEIPEGSYDTVGGFITYKLERIPEPGESLEYDGIRFEIAETDKKRITKLIVHTHPRKES
ncbi:MAG TPA: hemolysin family protein [Deltaproteobacteria bacterium]|nr:hemolysin family protein [Deltaproteobacteria bacterium]HQJ09711.1 hemolysin family protein [Deltaproteobacteria bacterium]